MIRLAKNIHFAALGVVHFFHYFHERTRRFFFENCHPHPKSERIKKQQSNDFAEIISSFSNFGKSVHRPWATFPERTFRTLVIMMKK